MQAAIIRVVRDRKTGKKISKEITDLIEVDEDEYYAPLVRIAGDDFLKKWNGGKLNARSSQI